MKKLRLSAKKEPNPGWKNYYPRQGDKLKILQGNITTGMKNGSAKCGKKDIISKSMLKRGSVI